MDDGSSDGSDKVLGALEDSTVRVITHAQNQGKGAAIRTGLEAATGDLVLIQDADLEYDPDDWPRLLDPMLKGKASVVYGSRFTGERKNMLPLHWFANRVLSFTTNLLYSSTLSDMETCYKLFDAKAIAGITIVSNRFDFEPEITAKVLRRGLRIYEVPISYAGREVDEGKKITWRDGFARSSPSCASALPGTTDLPRTPAPVVPGQVAAVVVDHNTGSLLNDCVRSLLGEGVTPVVVVENGSPGSIGRALAALLSDEPASPVVVVTPGRNLGYGAGVNRGLAALTGISPPPPWVIVANPDLHVHPGAVGELRKTLETHPAWALVGPQIYADDGAVYPSVRRFPSFLDTAGHALLALFNPENPFTKRYNPGVPQGADAVEAEWVSGSCFLPGARPSKSWVGSTRRISCMPRTWTCAGGRARRAGGSDSQVRPPSPTSRA